MPIRTILVPLGDAAGANAALGTAFNLAKTFKAHVDVLHLREDPTESVSDFVGESVSPQLVQEVIDSAAKRAERTARQLSKGFEDAVAKARVEVSDSTAAKDKATASFAEVTGYADHVLQTRGRVSDLIVAKRPRSGADVSARSIAEASLMETGRPVLLAPSTARTNLGTSVAIAWNGSVEASTAVAAALPFLIRAKRVTAISVMEGKDDDYNLDGLVRYLRWHGIRAKANAVRTRSDDTGKAVATAASRAKADLLVMGAYTHSRVREMILGGVTSHMLTGAGRIPVLLAH